MFGATSIVKNIGHGIAFDGKGTWSFGNNYARNVIMFGVDNIPSSHADNCKNNLLVLCEGGTFGIMEALVHQRKSLVLTLLRQR